MRAVVADTGPLNYLVLIAAIEILPRICETVLIPAAVRDELSHSRAPQLVQDWIAHPPPWLGVHKGKLPVDSALSYLDPGESQAIILASSLPQSVLLMDDREGTIEARRRGLKTLGTLGLLDEAASRGWIDLARDVSSPRYNNVPSPTPLDGAHAGTGLSANEVGSWIR